MRYELSDYEWSVIRPMLRNKPRGIPRVDDRRILIGIFWVLRSGAPWRDLPDGYGPHTTCYNRLIHADLWSTSLNNIEPLLTALRTFNSEGSRRLRGAYLFRPFLVVFDIDSNLSSSLS